MISDDMADSLANQPCLPTPGGHRGVFWWPIGPARLHSALDEHVTFLNRSVFLFGHMRQTIKKCGQMFGFVAFALCLSCSRSTPVQESVLVGTWQRVDKPAVSITYLKDGTFSAYIAGERMLGGKYRLLNGEQIVLELDASSPKTGSLTNRAFMSGEELRLAPVGGKVERYKRTSNKPTR